MHGLLSVVGPHAFPRQTAGLTTERVLVDEPLPHALLHCDHNDQGDITQSRLLYFVQATVSLRDGQAVPPQNACLVTFRPLVLVPKQKTEKVTTTQQIINRKINKEKRKVVFRSNLTRNLKSATSKLRIEVRLHLRASTGLNIRKHIKQ